MAFIERAINPRHLSKSLGVKEDDLKNLIVALSVAFVLVGCSTSPKKENSNTMLMTMSTENTYIVNGVEIKKTDHETLIAALKKTGQTNLLLTKLEMGDLLQISGELKAAGFSMFYLDSNYEIKAVNVD